MNALHPTLTPSLARLLSMPTQAAPPNPPQVSVEQVGSGVRIEEKVDRRESVIGLDELVKDGTLRSFTRQGDTIVAYADSDAAVAKLVALKREANAVTEGSVIDKARQLLVPPNMSESVAPEYLRYRAWSLAGSVLSGAIGFMAASVNLDAMKVAFATGANAAMAGFVNGLVYKATAMGSSYLARRGDADPKRWLLASSLVGTANNLLTVGLLCVLPQAYVPLNTYFAVTNAVGNTIGGAANINVFNHLAKGDNKGVVQSKNSNQDMLCDALGMPVALGISTAAHALGFNPYLTTVCVLGPALAFCNIQAARALHFESIGRTEMRGIADGFLENGKVPTAPRPGLTESLKSLFVKKPEVADPRHVITGSLDEVVKAATSSGGRADQLFGLFKDEQYVMSLRKNADGKDEIVTAFRDAATVQDVVKATVHLRLLEQLLDSGVPALLAADADRTLLVELTKRALPADVPDNHALADEGWHPNIYQMDLPRIEAGWSGNDPRRVSDLSLADLRSLLAAPTEDGLKKVLHP